MDMKSISQKLQDDIRAIMEAGLHPNQQRIDVHEPENDKITAHDFKKLRAMKKTKDGKVHNCATHVEHALLGAGTTISEQHAEPDEEGNIAWYTVQFDSGIKKVDTKDLIITMSEAHMHESEQVEEEEKKKPVSPFDYKNYQSQIPKKPGETAGFDSKKISTGTVYSRKPVKEDADLDEAKSESKKDMMARQQRLADAGTETAKDPARLKRMSSIPGYSVAMDMAKKATTKEATEYTFADYLEAARAQYVDEDAVLVANEAFKNKDITLFSDQSQSPEA